MSDETPEVACMVVHGDATIGIIKHLLIDFVDTAGDRFH